MKILHTSDWHLGQHFMGKTRRDEHQAFIQWLLELVEKEGIDAVIIAGDIFDTGSPPSYAREMYHQLVLDMKARQCQLLIVAGNHDSVSMLNESKSLLSYLDTQVSSQANLEDLESHIIPLYNKQGTIGTWVCAVPYLRPKDVLSSVSGQSEQDKKLSLLHQIEAFYADLYQLARQKNASLKEPVPIIGTGHLTAIGGQTSESVRDLYVGTIESLPTSVFPPFDYLALGHIHRAQAITKNGQFRYSGSPIPLSFDELGREKTLVLIDTDLLSKKVSKKASKKVSEKVPEKPHETNLAQTDLFAEQEEAIQLHAIPCFQPMKTLSGKLKDVLKQIEEIVQEHSHSLRDRKTLWLEITVIADEYLSDVHKRLLEAIEGQPIELLRVMRKSSQENKKDLFKVRQTLSELTVKEVFEKSLQSHSDIEEDEARVLTQIFDACVEEVGEQRQQEGSA